MIHHFLEKRKGKFWIFLFLLEIIYISSSRSYMVSSAAWRSCRWRGALSSSCRASRQSPPGRIRRACRSSAASAARRARRTRRRIRSCIQPFPLVSFQFLPLLLYGAIGLHDVAMSFSVISVFHSAPAFGGLFLSGGISANGYVAFRGWCTQ